MGKVRLWLAHGWKRWERESPLFFTLKWRQRLVKNAQSALPDGAQEQCREDAERAAIRAAKSEVGDFMSMMSTADGKGPVQGNRRKVLTDGMYERTGE